jgi:hypothetical protein
MGQRLEPCSRGGHDTCPELPSTQTLSGSLKSGREADIHEVLLARTTMAKRSGGGKNVSSAQGKQVLESGISMMEAAVAQHTGRMQAPLEGADAKAPLITAAVSENTPVQANESAITDELEKGGPALGSFVKAIGLAVAEAQTKLDETFVKTAQALSNQQIDVIAVFEQEIDDNGEMTAGRAITARHPLVNYARLPSHQFTRVHMQAEMKVSEFNSANGMNIRGGSTSFKIGAKGNINQLWNAGAEASFSTHSYNQAVNNSTSRDEAAGTLQLDATIEAREETMLPRPLMVQKGPRLKVTAGARQELKNTEGKPIGRQVEVTLELRGKGNNPLPGKRIEYKIQDSRINYDVLPKDGLTASNGSGDGLTEGTIKLVLRREGAMFDPAKPPEPVPVNVWFGLVNESLTLDL